MFFCVGGESRKVGPRAGVSIGWVLPAQTRFPLPPRAAATASAATATSTAPTTAASSTTTSLCRRRRRCDGEARQCQCLEEIDPHHRNGCQHVRQDLQAYSTRHVSCHRFNPFSPTMQVWIYTPRRAKRTSADDRTARACGARRFNRQQQETYGASSCRSSCALSYVQAEFSFIQRSLTKDQPECDQRSDHDIIPPIIERPKQSPASGFVRDAAARRRRCQKHTHTYSALTLTITT